MGQPVGPCQGKSFGQGIKQLSKFEARINDFSSEDTSTGLTAGVASGRRAGLMRACARRNRWQRARTVAPSLVVASVVTVLRCRGTASARSAQHR